ncbi:hypothetical protein AJ79_09703 [Helicocarpus griseus UAMH5409]|uniref:Uncharacterized protein n=1 Tax=Helicocarpus griseus UAMH5409 TaxID=1447875 RepID=A0A2B7WHU6_9EURO|nr:hypothetical protein AJ79_09703 [Helicocarpus griseus UAMH5409]
MLNARGWFLIGTVIIFFFASIPCAVLSLYTLCAKKNYNDGILTLDLAPLNISEKSIPQEITIPPDFLTVDRESKEITKTLHSAGKTRRDASSVLTTIKSGLHDMIPRSFSLGTNGYCVGYNNRKDCRALPADFSKIAEIRQSEKARSFDKLLKESTDGNIRGFLILALIMIPILAILLAWSMSKLRMTYNILGVQVPIVTIARTLSASVLLISFLFPTVILYSLLAAARQLPFKLERGGVGGYCLGALCCALVMVASATLAPVLFSRM